MQDLHPPCCSKTPSSPRNHSNHSAAEWGGHGDDEAAIKRRRLDGGGADEPAPALCHRASSSGHRVIETAGGGGRSSPLGGRGGALPPLVPGGGVGQALSGLSGDSLEAYASGAAAAAALPPLPSGRRAPASAFGGGGGGGDGGGGGGSPNGHMARIASGEVRAVQALSGLTVAGPDGNYNLGEPTPAGYTPGGTAIPAGAWNAAPPGGVFGDVLGGGGSGSGGSGNHGGHDGGDRRNHDTSEAALLARVLGLPAGAAPAASALSSGTGAAPPGLGSSTSTGGVGGAPGGGASGGHDDVHHVLTSLFGEDIARELAGGGGDCGGSPRSGVGDGGCGGNDLGLAAPAGSAPADGGDTLVPEPKLDLCGDAAACDAADVEAEVLVDVLPPLKLRLSAPGGNERALELVADTKSEDGLGLDAYASLAQLQPAA